MNNLRELLKEYDIKLNSLEYKKNIKILNTNKGKLVYKEKSHNKDIYEYLKTRGFLYYPKLLDINDNIEITEYIETKDIPSEQKLNDLIRLSGILHRKTSFNKEIDLDELKSIYENILNEVDYLKKYYIDLNNYIDNILFMSPSEYLLVSNIDLIYYLLDFVSIEITNWFNNIKESKTIRYSLIHNNLDLSHILEGENKYLISWNSSRLDMPIIDLIKVYKDNYYDLNLEDLIKEYESENKLNRDEYLFLLINLSIPKKIIFTNNTYLDCYNINDYLVYLKKIVELIQKSKGKKEKV